MKIATNLATPSSADFPPPVSAPPFRLFIPFSPLIAHRSAPNPQSPEVTVKKSLKFVRAGAGAMETPQRMIQRLGRQCYAVLCLGIVLFSVAVARYAYGPVEEEDRRGQGSKLSLQKSQS